MQRWTYVSFGTVISVIMCFVAPVVEGYFPRDMHPQAWAMTFIGCVILLASLLSASAELSVFALAWGWTAWFTALLDKPCPSSIFGFAALALFYTCRYVAFVNKESKINPRQIVFDIFLAFTITLFITAFYLAFRPL